MAATLCHACTMLPASVAKTQQHCCAPGARTQQTFLEVFRIFFCVRQKCCARGKTSRHLGNKLASAMLPPQCVLVYRASVRYSHESMPESVDALFGDSGPDSWILVLRQCFLGPFFPLLQVEPYESKNI